MVAEAWRIAAFNDERVVRAVFGCKIPVVCGVGHERDESLCDYAADVRASTPSNAAERMVPNRQEVLYEIETMTRHMESRLQDTIGDRQILNERVTHFIFSATDQQKEKFFHLTQNLFNRVDVWLPNFSQRLSALSRFLSSVDPNAVLARGYSIVSCGGQIVKDAAVLAPGNEVEVKLSKGDFSAQVLRARTRGKLKLL